MPINDIIAGLDARPQPEGGDPPEETNTPDGTPEPTTMRTAETLPPFLHIQTVKDRDWSLIAMAGTVVSLAALVSYFG